MRRAGRERERESCREGRVAHVTCKQIDVLYTLCVVQASSSFLILRGGGSLAVVGSPLAPLERSAALRS